MYLAARSRVTATCFHLEFCGDAVMSNVEKSQGEALIPLHATA
jgi:hypothetical protein